VSQGRHPSSFVVVVERGRDGVQVFEIERILESSFAAGSSFGADVLYVWGAMRTILHVDMDAFFASVEELDDPSLRGKPVLVGGAFRRGVVAAASYAARKKGARSAMPMAEALRRCPEAIVVPPRRERYAEVSARVFAIFRRYTPLVEGLSLDEAFLDVSESRALFGDGASIAAAIRAAIRAELALTASAGVATSKFVAKVASDLEKPDGLVVAPTDARELARFLAPLAVERMWGIGPKTAPRLRALGYKTFGDLAAASPTSLALVLGNMAERAKELAQGRDEREVIAHGDAKSIGSESTYEHDIEGLEAISRAVLSHAETVARRLTAEGLRARTIAVKIRLADFTLLSRQSSVDEPVCDTQSIHEIGRALVLRFPLQDARVRLVGVAAHGLVEEPRTRPLFPDRERERRVRIEKLVGALNEKHEGSVTRATLLEERRRGETWVGVAKEDLAKVSRGEEEPGPGPPRGGRAPRGR